MKIGIDARWIFAELSGIGAYTRELIRQLALQDRENEYVLFFDDENRMNEVMAGTGASRAARFRAHRLPPKGTPGPPVRGDDSRRDPSGLSAL